MGREQGNERIELPCKFGTLVCKVMRDDEDYREFAIDLYRNDGKVVQVCVVGTNEYAIHCLGPSPIVEKQHDMVHVYYYDGENQDCYGQHFVEPFGDGWWGKETL